MRLQAASQDAPGAGATDAAACLIALELDPPFEIIEPAEPGGAARVQLAPFRAHLSRRLPAVVAARRRFAAPLRGRLRRRAVRRRASSRGAPLLQALFPRAYLDVNREPYELDPRMFAGRLPSFAKRGRCGSPAGSARSRASSARRRRSIAERLPVEEALRRIEGLYRPYHRALRDLIGTRPRPASASPFWSIAIRCPRPPAPTGPRASRIQRGPISSSATATARAAIRADVECVENALRRRGYRVQRNKPYAGGYITEHYGTTSRCLPRPADRGQSRALHGRAHARATAGLRRARGAHGGSARGAGAPRCGGPGAPQGQRGRGIGPQRPARKGPPPKRKEAACGASGPKSREETPKEGNAAEAARVVYVRRGLLVQVERSD